MYSASRKPGTYFIGDVHGCLTELESLIALIDPLPEDRIIFLGDLINRGPDPVGVVRFVYENRYECLMGNHEAHYRERWAETERYLHLKERLGEEMHEWLIQRPVCMEDPRFIAVHGGLEPGKKPTESRPEILLNIRTWDGKGKDLKSDRNPPWYEFYTDDLPVIYGHWARAGLLLRENTIGIDSGCVYGNALTSYQLETGTILQVRAKRVYQQASP